MTREQYVKLTRDKLTEHGLKDWSIRLNSNANTTFMGLCSYKDKAIILSAHYIDTFPEPNVKNTILHEIAHALCPGMGHNEIWAAKARELGCDNTLPCSNVVGLNPAVIDAIRSGADVEVGFEEQVIRTPTYKITRLQDKCPECGKVAKEKSNFTVKDKEGNDVKFIILECLHIIKKIIPKGTPFHEMVSNSWMDNVKTCKHDWNGGNKCHKCGEFKLYEFQVEGCRFAETAINVAKGALIADEMGLGKTVQALGLLKYHPEVFPVLWIVKSGLKFQISKEILRWLGPEYIAQVLETGQHYIFPNFKNYIVSYDLIRRLETKQREMIEKLGIKTVILDECQQIKNPDSTRTKGVRILSRNAKVLGLSGTPWKNRGSEFFPILNMLDPMKFHSHVAFQNRWVDFYYEGPRRKEGGIKHIPEFKEYTKDIVLRRERTEVMKELPLINRMKLHVLLDEFEQQTYDDEVSEFVKWYNDYIQEGTEETIDGLELLAKMSRMRHIVGLAKIPATMGYLEEFIENEDRKIVVFAHHIDVQELLTRQCTEKFTDRNVYWLKGGMDPIVRFEIQEKFNKSPNAIMIASTLAAGEGLNLQTCADCILHERQWNPANEEQAEGRFIRIGQTATTVNATYTEGEGTIDSMFDAIVENKRRAYHAAMNKTEAPVWNQGNILRELASKIVEKFNKERKKKSNITSKVSIKK